MGFRDVSASPVLIVIKADRFMNPSDLAWWQWLLIGAGSGLVCVSCAAILDRAKDWTVRGLTWLIAAASGLAAFISVIIGLIRFVKWVWGS